MKTLEQLLQSTPDSELVDVVKELQTGIVPATGSAHGMCHKINRLIDKGELCINPTTYRKVYLPTLAKAVHKEMASRYNNAIMTGRLQCETANSKSNV